MDTHNAIQHLVRESKKRKKYKYDGFIWYIGREIKKNKRYKWNV